MSPAARKMRSTPTPSRSTFRSQCSSVVGTASNPSSTSAACAPSASCGRTMRSTSAEAGSHLGRPRPTLDVDVLVRPWEAVEVMAHLESGGFTTQRTYPHWLFKARRDGVVTDVIFVSTGDLYLDDEMVARLERREFMGRSLPVV